jgi:hypothetical protein
MCSIAVASRIPTRLAGTAFVSLGKNCSSVGVEVDQWNTKKKNEIGSQNSAYNTGTGAAPII